VLALLSPPNKGGLTSPSLDGGGVLDVSWGGHILILYYAWPEGVACVCKLACCGGNEALSYANSTSLNYVQIPSQVNKCVT
jgi:hypothetical protein